MQLEILHVGFFILFYLGISNAIETVVNCTEKSGTNACYTCMGRDMENCQTGTVCCSGACFKLIDEKHNLIMKGCTNEDQEDGSMKRRTFDIRLYWVRNEKVTGEAFYCKGSDYCNATSIKFIPSSLFYYILLSLLAILSFSQS
ncbi:putative integral membrane protein [Brugia pahangi]